MTMRGATQSGRFATQSGFGIPKAPGRSARVEGGAAQGDWRFEVLGLSPTADQEMIERAYWYQSRRYSATAAQDRWAAQRLAAVQAAYQALCSPIDEPWTNRMGPERPSSLRKQRREGLADLALMVGLLLLLVFAAAMVLNPSLRLQFDAAVQYAVTHIHHFSH